MIFFLFQFTGLDTAQRHLQCILIHCWNSIEILAVSISREVYRCVLREGISVFMRKTQYNNTRHCLNYIHYRPTLEPRIVECDCGNKKKKVKTGSTVATSNIIISYLFQGILRNNSTLLRRIKNSFFDEKRKKIHVPTDHYSLCVVTTYLIIYPARVNLFVVYNCVILSYIISCVLCNICPNYIECWHNIICYTNGCIQNINYLIYAIFIYK